MKYSYLSLAFLSFLLFSCNDNDNEIIENNTTDFPNIDNTQAMGVGTTLSAPTVNSPKLDSMKMCFYDNFDRVPANKYSAKTLPEPSTYYEVKHYFTYNSNDFINSRIINYTDQWKKNTCKLVFNYQYNATNELEVSILNYYENDNLIYTNSIVYNYNNLNELVSYTYQTPKYSNTVLLNSTTTAQFDNYNNLVNNGKINFKTPKNVFSPERNLLSSKIKMQYYNLDVAYIDIVIEDEDFYKISKSLSENYNNVNTHCTFPLKDEYIQKHFPAVSLDNIQYKVRQDHYPEIIQYGNVKSGGYRYLYYYKN